MNKDELIRTVRRGSRESSKKPPEPPCIIKVSGGRTVKYRERYLYSSLNPEAGAERRATRSCLATGFIYILASPLLFYGVSKLYEKLPEDSRLLFLETDKELAALTAESLSNHIKRENLPRETRLFTDTSSLLRFLDSEDLSPCRHAEIISLSGGYSLNKQTYDGCSRAVNSLLKTFWTNRATLIQMGNLWVDNLFSNLPLLETSAPLSQLYTEKPVVIAGAGESLEQTITVIRPYRESLFLLAVDTALPVLRDAEMPPDAVLALEGQHANVYDFFCDLNLPLISDLTASPTLLHQYKGDVSFILSRFDRIALFEKLENAGIPIPEIPPLGSVGIAALHLGLKLTSGPVFYSGLDFSFRPGKTHARSAPSLQKRLGSSGRLDPLLSFAHGFTSPIRKVTGKDGAPLLTTPNLAGYALLIEELEGFDRLTDLGKIGLPLPAASGGPEELQKALSSSPSPLPPGNTIFHKKVSTFQKQAREEGQAEGKVLHFLEREQTELAALTKEGYLWLSGERDRERRSNIEKMLGSLDYLTLSFPDGKSGKGFSESYLKRALVFADRLNRRIGKILNSPK